MQLNQLDNSITHFVECCDPRLMQDELAPYATRIQRLFGKQLAPIHHLRNLLSMLQGYISDAPGNIALLRRVAQEHDLGQVVEPLLSVGEEYLGTICAENHKTDNEVQQFYFLLHGAYIFHRTMEELDETFLDALDTPLTHISMMEANLIAREIIGESFADRVDQMICANLPIDINVVRQTIAAEHLTPGVALSGQVPQNFLAPYKLAMADSY